MPRWLQTAPGRYLLAWEQERLDAQVADVFGFHSVQLGLPQIDALRANRMPHRWLACSTPPLVTELPVQAERAPGLRGDVTAAVGAPPLPNDVGAAAEARHVGARAMALACDFDALPFASQSLDLVVLPHTLEFARDPHRTLAEVERVLVPEGRVVIAGFNPRSLWGLRQWGGRTAQRLGAAGDAGQLFLPRAGGLIAQPRLGDWLRLLSFEVQSGGFGCYRPPLKSDAWLARTAWMEPAGDRWWPVFGAIYIMSAVKRVRGMRLIGLARSKAVKARAAPAVVSQRREPQEMS